MKIPQKVPMPQTEADWLTTGKFQVENVTVRETPIKCALVQGREKGRLVTMAGGIPREVDRQRNLPLINKLYGQLAVELASHGVSSLLYNQPATGGSGGKWEEETLQSRTEVLADIVVHFSRRLSVADNALIGSSAGAYMAVSAAEKIKTHGEIVSKMILLSPAAYPEKVEVVPYGPEFSRLIREPWDVATSPVFAKLASFASDGGKVLTCFFEVDDPPIPQFIQEYYRSFVRQISTNGNGESIITIPGVAHNFRKLQRAKRENVTDDDSIRATAAKFLEFLI